MGDREEHCAFAILDQFGKCIAYCHHNLSRQYEVDCIGNRHVTPVPEFETDKQKRRI